MQTKRFTLKWQFITALTILAGLVYSSWPLGYILNPIANRGLASNLEGLHQPYNWVFDALDIVSGVLVVGVSLWLLRITTYKRSAWLWAAIAGYGTFGLLTAVDALIPIDCAQGLQQCGSLIDHPLIIAHGVVSMGSIAGLTVSIVSMWRLLAFHNSRSSLVAWLLNGTMLVWFSFGVGTLLLILSSQSSALSQHVFIVICSLWIAGLPYMIWRSVRLRSVEASNTRS